VTASANLNASTTQDVALGAGESELYVANENGYLNVLNASTLQSVRRVLLPNLTPFGLGVTPDGAQIYVTSPGTGAIAIVDSRPDGLYQVLPVGGTPRRIAFDATGSTAVISNEGNWVDVIR
jgi:YVTN family beta-propeller protein